MPPVPPLANEVETLFAGINNLSDPHAKKLFASLLHGAHDLQDVRRRLEKWFNQSMDRVSGIYKRNIQTWLYCWAAALVLFLNLDTIEIVRRLWTDSEFRTVLVNSAGRFVGDTNNIAAGASNTIPSLTSAEILQQINQVRLPLGWGQCTNAAVPGWFINHFFLHFPPPTENTTPSLLVSGILSGAAPCPQSRQDWLLKFLGLIISIGALSQGAPFWFDVLNKVTNLRAAGRPPSVDTPKSPPA